jgi:hypothetical protein
MIYWLGVPLPWRSQPAPPPPTAIPTGLAAISAPANQVSILLLVVDDRTSPQPWLEGCWLLTFKPGTNQYYLLGFPVDAPFSQQYTLRDYFNANSRVEDRSRFVEDALNHASSGGITVNYTLYLDEAVLAAFELFQFAGPVLARLTQHLIDQCRFAMIDVGDDGDIPQIVTFHVFPVPSS